MNVQFKASFAKDLRNIKNKDSLNRIMEAVEQFSTFVRCLDRKEIYRYFP